MNSLCGWSSLIQTYVLAQTSASIDVSDKYLRGSLCSRSSLLLSTMLSHGKKKLLGFEPKSSLVNQQYINQLCIINQPCSYGTRTKDLHNLRKMRIPQVKATRPSHRQVNPNFKSDLWRASTLSSNIFRRNWEISSPSQKLLQQLQRLFVARWKIELSPDLAWTEKESWDKNKPRWRFCQVKTT